MGRGCMWGDMFFWGDGIGDRGWRRWCGYFCGVGLWGGWDDRVFTGVDLVLGGVVLCFYCCGVCIFTQFLLRGLFVKKMFFVI